MADQWLTALGKLTPASLHCATVECRMNPLRSWVGCLQRSFRVSPPKPASLAIDLGKFNSDREAAQGFSHLFKTVGHENGSALPLFLDLRRCLGFALLSECFALIHDRLCLTQRQLAIRHRPDVSGLKFRIHG